MNKITTDVVIVGAGPVGLFQVFELGLLGMKSVVIDSLHNTGGQCTYLYPHKPIYDIPALPHATGQSTIDNLLNQCAPFDPTYLMNNKVTQVSKIDSHRFVVSTDRAQLVECKAVVIAAGNGAFEPVRLKVKGIEQFEGTQLYYHVEELTRFEGKQLVILGGGDSAFDWLKTLIPTAQSIVHIHRSLNFRASPSSVSWMQQQCEQLNMQFLCGQVTDFTSRDGRLTQLIVQSRDGVKRVVELEALLVFFGLSPKPGPISDWGLSMHRNQIEVDTEKFETSIPGIYAVGDINYYPGKRKLILSGFHEAALTAFAIKQRLTDHKVQTVYTTTNQKLQQLLTGE